MKFYNDVKNKIKRNSQSMNVNELKNKYDNLIVKSYILFGKFKSGWLG